MKLPASPPPSVPRGYGATWLDGYGAAIDDSVITEERREQLARAMFDRRCLLDQIDLADAAIAWLADPGIRSFWRAEADHCIEVLDA